MFKNFIKIIISSLVFVFVGCGYTFIGSGSSLPPNVKSVYIPFVTNLSSETYITPLITEALREEFEKMEDQVIIASSPSASKFILNIILKNHKASVIVEALSKYDVYVSTKSACSEHVKDDSSVLIEEGYSSYLASQAIRISFEGYEKEEDAINFMKIFKKVLSEVKRNG